MNSCLFCGKRPLSKEHVWGQWLIKFSGVQFDQWKKADHRVQESDLIIAPGEYPEHFVFEAEPQLEPGIFARNGTALHAKRKLVCKHCNNTWMSKIENQMRSILADAFKQGRLDLQTSATKKMAVWCALKGAMLTSAVTGASPRFDSSMLLGAGNRALENFSAGSIPDGWTVAIGLLLPPYLWGGHNLVYRQLHQANREVASSWELAFSMAGQVGPLGFWVTNSPEDASRLVEMATRNPTHFLLFGRVQRAPAILKPVSSRFLEDVLYEIAGRPEHFRRTIGGSES